MERNIDLLKKLGEIIKKLNSQLTSWFLLMGSSVSWYWSKQENTHTLHMVFCTVVMLVKAFNAGGRARQQWCRVKTKWLALVFKIRAR